MSAESLSSGIDCQMCIDVSEESSSSIVSVYPNEGCSKDTKKVRKRCQNPNVNRKNIKRFSLCTQTSYIEKEAMYVKLTMRRVHDTIVAWKSNKIYIFVCVCVCVRASTSAFGC